MRAKRQTLLTVPAARHDRGRTPDRSGDEPSTRGRVLVVDEHALTAAALRLALSERRWEVETSTGPTARHVLAHALRFQPHCVLLDIHLRNDVGSGIGLIEPFVSCGAHVVMLTAERRRTVLAECLEAGAAGWIGANAGLDEVDSTLDRVLSGGAIIGRTERADLLERLRLERLRTARAHAIFDTLTQREAHVLGALTDGLSAEEIAQEHFVALTTVRSQIRSVLQKLGVRSQLAAVAVASPHRDLLPHRGEAARERRRAHTAAAERERRPASVVHIA